ncbi:MAG: type I methionyl aminopeptidase, partial [Candidatus Omnitrophica bacterium]|nr:type I methionyl aminopeptidase [Candidatus Omnitrophota bacterium]
GITTLELDRIAEEYIIKHGAKPAFKGEGIGKNKFQHSICVSINEEIIHGIPKKDKFIKQGDIVSVDLGLKYKGLFVDCAYTYPVGRISSEAKKLIRVCWQALKEGIKRARVGFRIGDIGFAIQNYVEKNGFSVIRKFVGHGIGKALHCYPEVPNFGRRGEGELLTEGMVIAIEPMISYGSSDVVILDDGWTAKTRDDSLSCHFEHTVAITSRGPWVITR